MHVLVTGATGFLGRHLVPKLVAVGCKVTAVVRPRGSADPIVGASVIELDLGTAGWAEQLPQQINTIIHLAQSPHYREFPNSAPDIFNVNVAAVARLLDHAVRNEVQRVVIASTGSIYAPSAAPVAEDGAIDPPDYYASCKYAAELLASPYRELLTLCTFRIFRLYGSGQANALIPNLITRIRDDCPVTLAGPDGIRLTPTHVDDAARIFAVAAAEGWSGTFNLAAPHVITLRALCEKIAYLVGKKPIFEIVSAGGDVIPDTARLASRYDIGSMRVIDEGLREILEERKLAKARP
jgi:UDP-glucose 4-epimerase